MMMMTKDFIRAGCWLGCWCIGRAGETNIGLEEADW